MVQLELAVILLIPLVIPSKNILVAQIQKAQSEAPFSVVVGERHKPLRNRLVLRIVLGNVLPMTVLVDPEGIACALS